VKWFAWRKNSSPKTARLKDKLRREPYFIPAPHKFMVR
jgi:hypothetical protein